MGLGKRLQTVRLKHKLSQEKVAEYIGVSRQAVTKWEADQSMPSTENLLKPSELYKLSLDELVSEEVDSDDTSQHRKANWKKRISIMLACLIAVLGIGVCIFIYTAPVDMDAGACSGGYGTYIFDKYRDELVESYARNESETLVSAKVVCGSHEADWEGRTLRLSFNIAFENTVDGSGILRVTFIGKRVWTDTYKWGGALIDAGSIVYS